MTILILKGNEKYHEIRSNTTTWCGLSDKNTNLGTYYLKEKAKILEAPPSWSVPCKQCLNMKKKAESLKGQLEKLWGDA